MELPPDMKLVTSLAACAISMIFVGVSALFTLVGERLEWGAILPRRSPENYGGFRALFQPMDGG